MSRYNPFKEGICIDSAAWSESRNKELRSCHCSRHC